MVQVHVPARVWGFESLLRHQSFGRYATNRFDSFELDHVLLPCWQRARRVGGLALVADFWVSLRGKPLFGAGVLISKT